MAPKAVFLDFGGTLVEPFVDMRGAFERVAAELGISLPIEDYLRANDRVWEELWPRSAAYLGKLPSFADVVHERALRQVAFEGSVDSVVQAIRRLAISPALHRPFPEAERMLRVLHERGTDLHLLSNSVDYLPLLLRAMGWDLYFRTVSFAQEIAINKPDPRIFHHALRKAGIRAHDAIYVGDSLAADVEGSRGAGLKPIWLDRSRSGRRTSCPIISSLEGLPPLLD